MPRQILPHLEVLSSQIHAIINRYTHMLDDEFLFASAAQVPQVATIFDRIGERLLHFQGENLTLTELLTLIAYRYGLEDVRVIGHGGYAIVIGQRADHAAADGSQRRVMRLVPAHHVRDVTGQPGTDREFDVRLSEDGVPLRDSDYPLLLSDLFLMPRHTTKLVFHEANGQTLMAGGYPAILHCQLLPEVRAFNQVTTDTRLANAAGNLLEMALATLGVSVADAHGGNGGLLIGRDGEPIWYPIPQHANGGTYIPVVLDYGYYSKISAEPLAHILVEAGAKRELIKRVLQRLAAHASPEPDQSLVDFIATATKQSGLQANVFGRLLYQLKPVYLNPHIWIDNAEESWNTVKERAYPPLRAQSRLSRLYPNYDEVVFPQRIEAYTFMI